jgi:hypothetical protein
MERYTHPLRPELGPEGKFSGVNKKQEAAMGGGRAAPLFCMLMIPKRRCAQRTGAHARQNPLVLNKYKNFLPHLTDCVIFREVAENALGHMLLKLIIDRV